MCDERLSWKLLTGQELAQVERGDVDEKLVFHIYPHDPHAVRAWLEECGYPHVLTMLPRPAPEERVMAPAVVFATVEAYRHAHLRF